MIQAIALAAALCASIIPQTPARGMTTGSSSSLLTGLIAYWRLEEASGNRVDDVAGNNLSPSNTPSNATGDAGNGASFVSASSQYLSIADNATLSGCDCDRTFAVRFKLTTKTTTQVLFSKWTSGQLEFIIYYDTSADRVQFGVANSSGTIHIITASNAGAISTGTWYRVVGWYDATGDSLNVSVNGSSETPVSHSGGLKDSTASLNVGNESDNTLYTNGVVDEVGIWNRVLNSGERTRLMTAGTTYPTF